MDWHGLPVAIWAGLFSILGALIGAIAGSLVAPYFNYLFNARLKQKDKDLADRARQADLYKTIYPEKFRVTKELMDKAAAVYSLTGKILIMVPIKDKIAIDVAAEVKQLGELVFELRTFAGSVGWLVNANTQKRIEALAVSCLDAVGLTRHGGTYEKAKTDYGALCSTVKEELLMGEVDRLHRFLDNSPSTELTKETANRR